MPAQLPQDRSLVASIGAHESCARTTDRSARTAPARRALAEKFLTAAGGDPVRAEHLRRAYFMRLSLKSAQSRRKAREATAVVEAVEAELASAGGAA